MAAHGTPRPRLDRRLLAAASAIVGWILLLMVASGRRPGDRTWIGLPPLDDLMAVAFVAVVIWALVWTVRTVRFGGGATESRPVNLVTLWLGLTLAIAIVLVNPSIIERLIEDNPLELAGQGAIEDFDDGPTPPTDVEITTGQVYVALAVIGAWAALLYLSRRRAAALSGESREGDLAAGSDLTVPIDAMVADLEPDSDPRSAVMAAYQRLERSLAEQDRPRRATETPSEHLRRVLTGLPVDRRPFVDLAKRYELARFSSQTITAQDRDHAAAALTRARDNLAKLAGL